MNNKSALTQTLLVAGLAIGALVALPFASIAWPLGTPAVYSMGLLLTCIRRPASALGLARIQRPMLLLVTVAANLAAAFQGNGSWQHVTVTSVFVLVLLGPVAEELMMRGWVWSALSQRMKTWQVWLLTSLMFGALHIVSGPKGMLVTFILGMIMGGLRWRCRSVWAAIIFHSVHNAVALWVK